MPCPKQVNIPKMFRMWNTASMYGNFNVVSWSFNNTKPEELSTSCIKCGLCETKCPQNINIREDLEKAKEFLSNKEYFNEDVIEFLEETGELPNQRQIADLCKVSEGDISRMLRGFEDRLKKIL